MEPVCPVCGVALEYEEYFGRRMGWNNIFNEPIIDPEGDIYRCTNEECEEHWFHIFDGDDELLEGYPC